MRKELLVSIILLFGLFVSGIALAATTVPNDIKQPGTQPLEIQALDPVGNCAQCHGNYDLAVEPYHTWIGSMMVQETCVFAATPRKDGLMDDLHRLMVQG